MPFEPGNQLGQLNSKGKLIHATIKRACAQEDGKRIRAGIEKMLDLYAEGDPFAMVYIRDTLDGKPAQSLTVSGDDDKPLITMIKMVIVQSQLDDVVTIDQPQPLEIEHTGTAHDV